MKTAHEIGLDKMQLRSAVEGKTSETLISFRMRYDHVARSMSRSGMAMPMGILLNKVTASMKLSSTQLSVLFSRLESEEVGKASPNYSE